MKDIQVVIAIGSVILGLIVAAFIALGVLRQKVKSKRAKEVSVSIREGAMTFLSKEYKILSIFVLAVAAILGFTDIGMATAIAFIIGAILSGLAGYFGMRIATAANARTAEAVKKDTYSGFKVAFSSGSVMGLIVVSLGLGGIAILYLVFKDPRIIYGFGFGASSVALFARVGGGIFTKAADVGADLVGKVEAGIEEDDARNPATIADSVGDNVGDVAGMGADLFESYVDSIIAAMVLGVTATAIYGDGIFRGISKLESGASLITLPLAIGGLGIISSLLGILIIKFSKSKKPHAILNRGIFGSAIIMATATYFYVQYIAQQEIGIFFAVITGLIGGVIIGLVTEFYTSERYRPTRMVAEASQAGSATNIISGMAVGMKSTIIPLLVVVVAIFLSFKFMGLYGIAIAAVGMLSTLGITLAADAFGPVVDNAAGIAEMAGMGKETRKRAEELDSVGNTTAAIGKGFAIGSAALTAIVLSVSYTQLVGLNMAQFTLNNINVLIGLFIGGLLPFVFSALSLSAVSKTASAVVSEVRRQFKEIPGIMQRKTKPEYNKCVEVVSDGALKHMIPPSLLAVIVPSFIGFILGKEALGGFLIGAILTGFLLAIMMANSGGVWDNAKKYIEAGNFGGKGSDSYKAAVIGDTVGDPFKDAAGPSLNILIKLMSIVALIIAPLL